MGKQRCALCGKVMRTYPVNIDVKSGKITRQKWCKRCIDEEESLCGRLHG